MNTITHKINNFPTIQVHFNRLLFKNCKVEFIKIVISLRCFGMRREKKETKEYIV